MNKLLIQQCKVPPCADRVVEPDPLGIKPPDLVLAAVEGELLRLDRVAARIRVRYQLLTNARKTRGKGAPLSESKERARAELREGAVWFNATCRQVLAMRQELGEIASDGPSEAVVGAFRVGGGAVYLGVHGVGEPVPPETPAQKRAVAQALAASHRALGSLELRCIAGAAIC